MNRVISKCTKIKFGFLVSSRLIFSMIKFKLINLTKQSFGWAQSHVKYETVAFSSSNLADLK